MPSAELLTPAFCSWQWGSLVLSNQGETLDDAPRISRHFLYGFSYFFSCGSDHFLHVELPWSLASVSWNCTLDLMSLPQTWSWFILIGFLATSERCSALNCFSCRRTHGLEVWNKWTNKQANKCLLSKQLLKLGLVVWTASSSKATSRDGLCFSLHLCSKNRLLVAVAERAPERARWMDWRVEQVEMPSQSRWLLEGLANRR